MLHYKQWTVCRNHGCLTVQGAQPHGHITYIPVHTRYGIRCTRCLFAMAHLERACLSGRLVLAKRIETIAGRAWGRPSTRLSMASRMMDMSISCTSRRTCAPHIAP